MALTAALAAFGMTNVWAADKANVRAGIHDGFARIAFDSGKPVKYRAEIDGRNLIVRFDQPLEAELSPVRRFLKDYVVKAAASNGGRVYTFSLARPFTLRARTFDNVVALDLIEQPKEAATSGKRPSGKKPFVRVGQHSGFSRLVFDWPRSVDYRIDRNAGNLAVEFSDPDAIDLAKLKSDPPVGMSLTKSWSRGGRRTVDIAIPSDARVRHFRDGNNVVVDVLIGSTAKARSSAARNAPAPPGAKPRSIVPRSLTPRATAAAPQPPKQQKTAESRVTPPSSSAAPETEAKMNAVAKKPVATSALGAGPAKLRLKLAKIGGGLRMEFPWTEQTPAAVVHRAGYLWVVFSHPAEVDFNEVKPTVSGIVRSAEQLANDRATVLRFGLQEGLVPTVDRKDNTWTIDLKVGKTPVLGGVIEVRPEPSATTGPRVFLAVNEPGNPVTVKDPEVGDYLLFAPVLPTGRGVLQKRSFVEFDVLPTVQGVAVTPWADGVDMISQLNGVAVTIPGGLSLSHAPLEGGLYASGGQAQTVSTPGKRYLFDYPRWRRDDDGEFTEVKQKLQNAISDAPPTGRNAARLDLAQFYFAHGFATETLAVLRRISASDKSVLADPAFLALRGAARVMSNRLNEAEADLGHQSLAGKTEINVWRGLAASKKHDWPTAREQFATGMSALRSFPPDVRSNFQLAWAEAAVKAGDARTARVQVELAGRELTSSQDLLRAKYLEGRVDEEMGQLSKALEKYQEVIDGGFRPTRVRAEAASIRVQLEQGALTRPEAIEAYEKLRYAWRGDDFELQLLQNLGHLYIKEGKFREGLEIMRQAVTYYPKSDMASGTAQAMSEEFARLFLDGDADSLPPVKALGLYYDFRELTPVGERGDMMISKLADRLVAVDLLDQAAKLLEHQVDFRLKGEEKARVAARLAVIQLLDRKPDKALKALRDSQWTELPPVLAAERVRLEARALTELDRLEEALDVLQASDEPEAEALRADVYWRWKKWDEAASSFAALLGERWKQDDPLDERSRYRVMQQAISLSLANDRIGLDALRDHYQPFFKGTPEEKSFQVITARVNREGADFRELASTIAQVGQLEAFMASYREKLRNGQLSAIN